MSVTGQQENKRVPSRTAADSHVRRTGWERRTGTGRQGLAGGRAAHRRLRSRPVHLAGLEAGFSPGLIPVLRPEEI